MLFWTGIFEILAKMLDTFIQHTFIMYLKKSCGLVSDQHFLFKYFPGIALSHKDITRMLSMC